MLQCQAPTRFWVGLNIVYYFVNYASSAALFSTAIDSWSSASQYKIPHDNGFLNMIPSSPRKCTW
nr:MAG TPA: hypothetical protein [Caudoviricetes sp.]